MASIHVKQLGVLLRVHRRHEWLPVIWKQIRELSRKRWVHLVVMADRPSPEVIAIIGEWERHPYLRIRLTLVECPEPIRTSTGCRWTETMQFMYRRLRDDDHTTAAMVWDDDVIFSDDALLELRAHLDLFEYDRVEVDWLQINDEQAETHDAGFLRHRATCLFRVYPDDDWSDILTKTIIGGGTASPIYVARSPLFMVLDGHVLHMGYCSPDRREHAWNAARACGQIDGYFRQLARPPKPLRCLGTRETSRFLSGHLAQAQRTR